MGAAQSGDENSGISSQLGVPRTVRGSLQIWCPVLAPVGAEEIDAPRIAATGLPDLQQPAPLSEVLMCFSIVPENCTPNPADLGFVEPHSIAQSRGEDKLSEEEAERLLKVADMKRAFYQLDRDGSGGVDRWVF